MAEGTTHNQSDDELKDILNRMVTAFNEFHAQMTELEKRQYNVISHIRERIDAQKLEELKKTLHDI